VVEHHLDAYGLRDTVTHVQGDYTALMKQTIEAYQDGEPILFYTWTPNWTVSALSIGEDVMWLGVPFSFLPDDPDASTQVASLPGCLETPCNTGFGANDIRAVANVEFLAENPAAAKLLELVEIPLADIAAQNVKMLAGERAPGDVRHHAEEWIEANRETADGWLADARVAAR
jgi:glycine betaine/proline transport system substrate-binding protein